MISCTQYEVVIYTYKYCSCTTNYITKYLLYCGHMLHMAKLCQRLRLQCHQLIFCACTHPAALVNIHQRCRSHVPGSLACATVSLSQAHRCPIDGNMPHASEASVTCACCTAPGGPCLQECRTRSACPQRVSPQSRNASALDCRAIG